MAAVNGGDPTFVNQGALQAVEDSKYAMLPPEEQDARKKEEEIVSKLWEEYEDARRFDQDFRRQVAVDRRYAAGTSDPTWAVNTNLIGTFIDILVSFLYARDPDVNGKKTPKVNNSGTADDDNFGKTAELVVSKLWKQGKLKKAVRKQVRSTLSVSEGWFKAVLIAEKPVNPQMQAKQNDLRDNIAALEARKAELEEGSAGYEDASADLACQMDAIQKQMDALALKTEASVRKYMAIDFVAVQDMQVSLDVASVADYLDADWNANGLYILKKRAKERFPRLSKEDIDGAACYYQKQVRELQPLTDVNSASVVSGAGAQPDMAEQYTKGTSQPSGTALGSTNTQGPEFIKVVELWDRRDNHIKTMVDGVKRWAVEPFQPAFASSRFYPYFYLGFFEIDGARHAQSLSWRLSKNQDEYARSRSNWRVTRERAIPATMFDKGNISEQDAERIQQGVHQEFIGISPTDPTKPLQDNFASKPYERIDVRMFENAPILADMEKVSGVQEALQSSTSMPKTATQAEIEQSGFASRTTADRDTLEDMLDDFAQYTLEVSLNEGAITIQDAQRIAGADALWPAGMELDDLLTMVEIEIEAGTTGKPKKDVEQQAWGVILPVVQDSIVKIYEALAMGNIPLAKALSNLVKETMVRMGDDTDPDSFLPEIPDAVPGALPGPNGAPLPGDPTQPLPPDAGATADGGASPLENPTLAEPSLAPPSL